MLTYADAYDIFGGPQSQMVPQKPASLSASSRMDTRREEAAQVLSLLALLAQKYKYYIFDSRRQHLHF
jgi:hypothetical protein